MTFTTRPELQGTFGMVTSTHWLASAAGMRMLELGGNAFDAAVATGMCLAVVEPHLNGPLGDLPAMIWPAGDDAPRMICAQGTAPAAATIEHYRAEGLERVPGAGQLATVTPGAFDGWMLMLRDFGTMKLRDVMEPALSYAQDGHPLLGRVADTIAGQADFFSKDWPTSAAVWLPGGSVPTAGSRFCNPELAAFWTRLLQEAESQTNREAQIDAARNAFYNGFVAEAIDRFVREAELVDGTGDRRKGVLCADDLANWSAHIEPCEFGRFNGFDIWKGGFWSQGPVLLQMLGILDHTSIADVPGGSAEFVHLATEAMKLAFADRDAYYGDPLHADVPTDILLSADYARERAAQIGPQAADDLVPGAIAGHEFAADMLAQRLQNAPGGDAGIGGGEPTMAHVDSTEGDTVHLDVVDRWGNMVSATPSGGWLQSNAVVPGLGVPLNTRAQMFWLDEGLPSSLAPGRRPRTTLSPSFGRRSDGTRIAFGTPGGDRQDQWQLFFLLHLMHHNMNLQQAIDAPLVISEHLEASFHPRGIDRRKLLIEPAFGEATMAELRDRGHRIEVAEPWSLGRMTAAERSPDGILRAAATPRLMQAYAVGR